jgi:hypothetical protein
VYRSPRPPGGRLRPKHASGTGIDGFWIAHIEVMPMASMLTPEDVVRRIAAECTFIDERGAIGIRLKPAAAIVRQYGEQFRRLARRKQNRRPQPPPLL